MLGMLAVTSSGGCGFDWSLPPGGQDGGSSADGGGGNPSVTNGPTTGPTTTGNGGEPQGGAPVGPNGTGGAPDPTSTTTTVIVDACDDCAAEAANNFCESYWLACQAEEGCEEITACAQACDGDLECVEDCTNGHDNDAVNAFIDVAACTICGVCFDACPEYARVCSQ